MVTCSQAGHSPRLGWWELLLAAGGVALLGWLLLHYQPLVAVGDDLLAGQSPTVYLAGERRSLAQLPTRQVLPQESAWWELYPDDFVRYRLVGPFHHDYLMVRSGIAVEGVVRGERPWEDGRVALVGVAASGKRLYDRDTVVCARAGSVGPLGCEGVFAVHPKAEAVIVVAVHRGEGGVLRVAPPTLHYATPHPTLPWIQGGIALLWLLAAGLALRQLAPAKTGLLLLLLAGIVVIHAVLPQEQLRSLLHEVRSGLMQAGEGVQQLPPLERVIGAGEEVQQSPPVERVIGAGETSPATAPLEQTASAAAAAAAERNPELNEPWLQVHHIQAGGHFLLFALLGMIAAFRWLRYAPPGLGSRTAWALLSFAWLALFAAATEVTQMALLSRSGRLEDLWIDLWGVFCGIPAGVLLYALSWRLGRERRGAV